MSCGNRAIESILRISRSRCQSSWARALGWLALFVSPLALSFAAHSSSPSAFTATLDYSGLLGSDTLAELGLRIVVDAQGAVYVTGTVVEGVAQNPGVFVTKLSPDAKTTLYHTILGGTGIEIAGGLAVDANGNAYVTGSTGSSDFPTKSGIQFRRYGDTDAFVVKLDPEGKIVYATLLGGTGNEQGRGIAVDRNGAAYVTGSTTARDFLVPNVKDAPVPRGTFQGRLMGPADAFVAKINPSGSAFEFKTFLGGTGTESGVAIAVDDTGSCYVFGITDSPDFPTKKPAQRALGGGVDTFIAKFSPQGSELEFATYLGGSANEVADFTTQFISGGDIALDADRNVYVASDTFSADFPVTSGLQNRLKGEADGFVAKLAADGSVFRYITYFGGTHGDSVYGIAVAPSGAVAITGATLSSDFPITSPVLQTRLAGENDLFVAWLDAAGSSLNYATFLGGTGFDIGNGIALAPSGAILVTGLTTSGDFPITTERPAKPRLGFVAKLSRGDLAPPLRFQSVGVNTGGDFEMKILAPSGQTHRVESSSNLRDWLLVKEFTAPGGFFELTWTQRPGEKALFFRLRTP